MALPRTQPHRNLKSENTIKSKNMTSSKSIITTTTMKFDHNNNNKNMIWCQEVAPISSTATFMAITITDVDKNKTITITTTLYDHNNWITVSLCGIWRQDAATISSKAIIVSITTDDDKNKTITITTTLGKVAKKKPEKVWSFAKLPSDPPPQFGIFPNKKITPIFFWKLHL